MIDSNRRNGLTLVEVMVASGLMAVLAVVMSATWSGLGRPAADILYQHRVVQEAHLAVAALARDLGGASGGPGSPMGRKEQGRFVGWMQPAGSQLWLCFDGGDSPNDQADWGPPDTVVTYELQSDRLVRCDRAANASFTVARCVESLKVVPSGDNALEIRMTFKFRSVEQTYILVARKP